MTKSSFQSKADEKKYSRIYVLFALAVLLFTTVFWSALGAKVQSYNADQLSYPLQFLHYSSLQKAVIPGTHSFLIKWPLFIILALIGPTFNWLLIATVLICLLTVGGFAYFIYRIEKRPWVFGTLCLALASILLMIPAEPFAGSLLPVNMAMLTTRNICYLILILGVYLALNYKKIRSWTFFWAVLLVSLIFASDKLFLTMGVGGALLALIVFMALKMKEHTARAFRWLIVSLAAAILSEVILVVIKALGITSLSNVVGRSPYAFVHSFHLILKGSFYTVMDLAQNFGANPSANNSFVSQVAAQAHKGFFSPGGPAYLINFLIFLISIYAGGRLIWSSLRREQRDRTGTPFAASTTLLLFAISFVSIVLFIFTNHDYSLDSRYITISMFALFAALALYTRTRSFKPKYLMLAGLVITGGIIFGSIEVRTNYHTEVAALAPIKQQAAVVATELANNHTSLVVGNYWPTIPVRYFDNKVNIIALYSCTDAVDFGAPASQLNLHKNGFAYLLDYSQCDLNSPLSQFGRPAKTVLISGTPSHPTEQLLFYPNGITLDRASNATPPIQ